MPFTHGSKAAIYVNGYDLTPFIRSVSGSAEVDTAEVTTLGCRSKAYIPGLSDATISAEGVYDGAVDAVDQVLQAALGQDNSIWNWMPDGDANGKAGYGFAAIQTSYEIETPVDDVAVISAESQSKVGQERLIALHAMAQEAATGNGTSQDNTIATAEGGAGYLQVITRSGSLTVKIQHSSDNGSTDPWTDLVTFTTVAADHMVERKEISGSVKRYLRVTWAGSGKFFVGFNRK